MPEPIKVMANQTNDKAGELIRLYQQLYSSRSLFEVQWQEISELIQPVDSMTFQGQQVNAGQKKTQKQYDSTGTIALKRFMAITDSLLTPHNAVWHTLTSDDAILNRNYEVRTWFEDASKILFRERYNPRANFIDQIQQNWVSIGAYGSGGLFIDQLWGQKGLRYKFIPVSNLYFAENHQGTPDKIFRHYRMTARQAVQKWGDRCPEIIISNNKTQPESVYEFLHCIMPRDDYDPKRKDYRGMPWASYEISLMGGTMLSEGGYRSFPMPISRYAQSTEQVYGLSPAMDILPTLKTLNQEKKDLLKQAHRILDPMYLVHDDGVLSSMSARPGTVIPGGVTSEGRALVHTLPTGNVQIGQEIMQDDRNDIKDAFFTSLFQILVETPEMTATEVMERIREKGILIAPAFVRQESFLCQVIERELDLLNQQGMLPPMPQMLIDAGGEYKVRFESPLARMRRAEEATGLLRMLDNSLQIAQATQDPSIMYWYNWDTIMPAMAEIQGVPFRWMNTLDKVNAMREGQQQAQETQNLIQAGPAVAAVMKATQGKPGVVS